MSKEAALAFRNKVSQSPELQAKVRKALETGQGLGEAVRLGAAAGFTFSEADAEEALRRSDSEELSDFELAMVAGGTGKGANPQIGKPRSDSPFAHQSNILSEKGAGFKAW